MNINDTTFWQNYYTNLTNKNKNNEHVVNCFFYIKGSKDYPVGQNLDEPFGYDDSNGETPLFTNSIKDIYASKSNLLEVFNNYSLETGDVNNKIDAEVSDRTQFFGNDLFGNQRNNGNPDYVSTLLIDTSMIGNSPIEKELFKHINPNFNLLSSNAINNGSTISEYIADIDNQLISSENQGQSVNNLYESMELRFNIFWKEIFSCFERIKRYEDEICLKYGQSNLPTDLNKHFLSTSNIPWFDDSTGNIDERTKISYLRKCNNVTAWLWAMYPSTDLNVEIGDGESKPLKYKTGPDGYYVNPFRLVDSQPDLIPSNQYINNSSFLNTTLAQLTSSDDSYARFINQVKDQLVGLQWWWNNVNNSNNIVDNPTNLFGDNPPPMIKNGINLQLVAPSASDQNITVVSDINNRIKSFSFKVKFIIARTTTTTSGVPKTTDIYDTWLFNVYFDPEDFIRANNANASIFPIWSFNEKEIDESIRTSLGTIETPGLSDPAFNYLDNDYANALVPNNPESANIRNHFIASKTEIQSQFISELIKKVKDGGYEHYVTLSVDRVTPLLSPDKKTIVWDPSEYNPTNGESNSDKYDYVINNITSQEFYIFYKGTVVPSIAQQKEAVRTYLKNLHTKCNPTTYKEDNITIKTIGHGHDEQEITNFLSNMYPDLFSKSEIFIIPTKSNYHNGDDASVASSYYNTITPERIAQSIRSIVGVPALSKYTLHKYGENNQLLETENGLALPTEIFYIGSINSNNPNDSSDFIQMQFPMPWYAVSTSLNAINTLTNIAGFENYKPRSFNSNDISTLNTADLFQLIMIVLTTEMFKDDLGNKKRHYSDIFGCTLNYTYDRITDSELNTSNNVNDGIKYNVVEFDMKGISFKVYAQQGKYFASSNSVQISYQIN